MTHRCPHCESETEVDAMLRASCPTCGLDPSLPRLAFEDAPAFFLAGDPRLEPMPVGELALEGAPA